MEICALAVMKLLLPGPFTAESPANISGRRWRVVVVVVFFTQDTKYVRTVGGREGGQHKGKKNIKDDKLPCFLTTGM